MMVERDQCHCSGFKSQPAWMFVFILYLSRCHEALRMVIMKQAKEAKKRLRSCHILRKTVNRKHIIILNDHSNIASVTLVKLWFWEFNRNSSLFLQRATTQFDVVGVLYFSRKNVTVNPCCGRTWNVINIAFKAEQESALPQKCYRDVFTVSRIKCLVSVVCNWQLHGSLPHMLVPGTRRQTSFLITHFRILSFHCYIFLSSPSLIFHSQIW